MTSIIFPRPIIAGGVLSQGFDPQRVDYMSPETGGRVYSVAAGTPLWSMSLGYNNLLPPEAYELKAWVDSLDGSKQLIFAYDIDREIPLYHQTGRPFEDTPATWSQTINGDGVALLELTGLLPGQIVTVGDYVGFAWGDNDQCTAVRALETVQIDAGGSTTFAVTPAVPTLVVPPEATTTLRRAGCLMRLVTTETKLMEIGTDCMPSGSKVVAIQDLIP